MGVRTGLLCSMILAPLWTRVPKSRSSLLKGYACTFGQCVPSLLLVHILLLFLNELMKEAFHGSYCFNRDWCHYSCPGAFCPLGHPRSAAVRARCDLHSWSPARRQGAGRFLGASNRHTDDSGGFAYRHLACASTRSN